MDTGLAGQLSQVRGEPMDMHGHTWTCLNPNVTVWGGKPTSYYGWCHHGCQLWQVPMGCALSSRVAAPEVAGNEALQGLG